MAETILGKNPKASEDNSSSYIRLALQYEKELERAKTPEARQQVRKNYNKIMGNFSNEERVEGQKQLEIMRREEPMAKMNEGSLMVPEEGMPVDTYPNVSTDEEIMEVDLSEYWMRKFRKMLEKHENSKIPGPRAILPGKGAII